MISSEPYTVSRADFAQRLGVHKCRIKDLFGHLAQGGGKGKVTLWRESDVANACFEQDSAQAGFEDWEPTERALAALELTHTSTFHRLGLKARHVPGLGWRYSRKDIIAAVIDRGVINLTALAMACDCQRWQAREFHTFGPFPYPLHELSPSGQWQWPALEALRCAKALLPRLVDDPLWQEKDDPDCTSWDDYERERLKLWERQRIEMAEHKSEAQERLEERRERAADARQRRRDQAEIAQLKAEIPKLYWKARRYALDGKEQPDWQQDRGTYLAAVARCHALTGVGLNVAEAEARLEAADVGKMPAALEALAERLGLNEAEADTEAEIEAEIRRIEAQCAADGAAEPMAVDRLFPSLSLFRAC